MPQLTRLFLLSSVLSLPLSAAETPPVPPAVAGPVTTPIPAALAQAITREVLRPNGDPEGLPLPLAARWTSHNLLDGNSGSPSGNGYYVSYPFPLDRILDDIAAGHRVMPFMGWPLAKHAGGGYYEAEETFLHGFRRLAAAKLPFEIEPGNIEGLMFKTYNDPLPPYIHKPAAENAAFLANGDIATLKAAAKIGDTSLVVKGMAANAGLPAGLILLAKNGGRAVILAADAKADATGTATLTITEAMPAALSVGDALLRLERRIDVWSRAPEAVWRAGGAAIPIGAYSLDDWKSLAALYPDPPQVQIVSNNEGARVRIAEAPASWHAQQTGGDTNASFAAGYIRNWKAYLRGMRETLPWKPNTIKAIGYNAFGVNFEVGRWQGWAENMVSVGKVDCYEWLAWDGAAPDYYAYDWNYATDEHVGSPHIGAMQAYTMLSKRAMAQVPGYLWQLALWDGGPKKRYRYAGDGTLTGIPVGTIATAPEAGALSLSLTGAKPGATILDTGDLIGITGHSEGQPTRCGAEFDHLVFETVDGAQIADAKLILSDVGKVPAAGILSRQGDRIQLSGSGCFMSAGPDAMTFAQIPFKGMRSVSVRLAAFSEAQTTTKAGTTTSELASTVAHVDRDALAKQRANEQYMPTDQAGLMLRNGTGPTAAYLWIVRNRSGELQVGGRYKDSPAMTEGTGNQPPVNVPPGPVYVRWVHENTNHYRPSWSSDGVTWTVIGDPGQASPWIVADPGSEPLIAGLVVTTNRSPANFLYYTVKSPVVADARGTAAIPLDHTQFGGPIGYDNAHPPIVAGATVNHLDYTSRYEGFCNLALWLTRPRIVREFAWGDYDHVIDNHWKALMRATDRVWNDPVLTRFWRKGKLLANPAYAEQSKLHHPMKDIGEFWGKRWAGDDCFFQLSVAINPPFSAWPSGNALADTRPNHPSATIKVWAIAYELGTKPKREWLLVTQSPREDRKAVQITVPGFGDIVVDVARRGSFYLLREGAKTAELVGAR